MRKLFFLLPFLLIHCKSETNNKADDSTSPSNRQPNILFIAVDDLNDWTGTLGGHPATKTPNLDQLAGQGVQFTHAYCPAPACNPSRAALMTGIMPSTSGVYQNPQPWRESPVLKDILTLPQYFREHGYKALGSGKIFHGSYPDLASWDEYWPSLTQTRPEDPEPSNRPVNGIPNTRHFDWGPVDVPNKKMGDHQVADWVIEQINKKHDKPFFLACGFYRPHLPWYVPPKYFEKFPVNQIKVPEVPDNDLEDVPEAGKKMARQKDHENVTKYNQWEEAVQGYLASISFMDDCLGRVLEALENSRYKENTIVVLWSDHGWHLGEKHSWRKFTLWEEATRCVLMFDAPGTTPSNATSNTPVNLMDIYPTLVELAGLPPKENLEGKSLVPLLKDPDKNWERPSLTTFGRNNHALRTKKWRYIRYADGSEELYNHEKDSMEWNNLAGDPQYNEVKAELAQWLPEENAENAPFDPSK